MLEPIYSAEGKINVDDDYKYSSILNEPIKRLKEKLNLEITTSDEGVIIGPSHNPLGYYRDI